MTGQTEPLMVRRVRIANAVRVEYFGKPLDYAQHDCRRMLAMAAELAGRRVPLLRQARFTTPGGALKWLKRHGFDGLIDAVDASGLQRIAPARLLPADFVALPAAADGRAFGAGLGMWLGDGQALGWGEGEAGAGIMAPHDIRAAWRLIDG